MAWTTTTTLVSDLSNSVITLFDAGVMLGYTPELTVNQVATVKRQINAKAITFNKFDNLSLISSTLTEDADVTSVVIADNAYTLTPGEYGNVITYGKLSNYQTGGKVDTGAAMLVGRNMGASVDKLGVTALEAHATTLLYGGEATSVATLTADDNLTRLEANRLYNKLARNNVMGINGQYYAIAHDDCLHDLREALVPVRQYQDLTGVLNNEVGFASGIRWLRSSNVTVTSDGGVGTVDSYKVCVVGANALGLAIAEEPHPTITGPFDKVGRFLNIGWYGLFKWGLLDTGQMCMGHYSSSVGANT